MTHFDPRGELVAEAFRKTFGQDTGAILAGASQTFGSISLPSTPALDSLAAPPLFDEITIYIAVSSTAALADLTITAFYNFQPVKNGPAAAFALTPSGVSLVQTVPAAPGASLVFTVTSGGAAAHTLTVAYGAQASPRFVEDPAHGSSS